MLRMDDGKDLIIVSIKVEKKIIFIEINFGF